jgi:hypothetical protein
LAWGPIGWRALAGSHGPLGSILHDEGDSKLCMGGQREDLVGDVDELAHRVPFRSASLPHEVYRHVAGVSIVFAENSKKKFFYFSMDLLLTCSCLAFRMRKGARAGGG